MNRKYLLAAALTATVAIGSTIGADMASASSSTPATSTQPARTVNDASLGTSHYLPLSVARQAADAAMAACAAKGYPVAVTVLDREGIVIDQEVADNTSGPNVADSEGKAYAAIGAQAPSATLSSLANTYPGLTTLPGFVVLPGALPISGGGSIIAALGVSGAVNGFVDADCAAAGVKAIS